MLTSPYGFTNPGIYILNPLPYPLQDQAFQIFANCQGPFLKVFGWIFQLLILPQLPQHLHGDQSQDSLVLPLTPIAKV